MERVHLHGKGFTQIGTETENQMLGDPKTGLINSGKSKYAVPEGKESPVIKLIVSRLVRQDCHEHRRGLIYSKPLDAHTEKAVDTFGWNEYRILAEGPRIQVWINGVKAGRLHRNQKIPLDGVIMPQIHSGAKSSSKEARIRELPPTLMLPTWNLSEGIAKDPTRRRAIRRQEKKRSEKDPFPTQREVKYFRRNPDGLQGWRTVDGVADSGQSKIMRTLV